METIELIDELNDNLSKLDKAVNMYANKGIELANAEQIYRISKSNRIIEHRNKEVPVTIIEKIVNGEKEIAEKRLNRDIALANYKACQEFIQVQKLKIKILQDILNKEYGRIE